MRRDDNAPKQTVVDRSLIGGALSGGYIEGVSFSGNERNNLFLSLAAKDFEDVSGVSGMDHPADGRAMGLFDYDRDGWVDLAIVNANSPLLQIYRNGLEKLVGKRPVVAVRFVGGNQASQPSDAGFAPRDGFGAVALLEVGGDGDDTAVRLVREHRAGEGFATQNSATELIALGEGASGGRLSVRWPSGRVQEIGFVPAGTLITAYEDPKHSADGSGFAVSPYRVDGLAERAARAPRDTSETRSLGIAGRRGRGHTAARLKLVTTMATWCEACKAELPQLANLRSAFGVDDLEILGVPVDENDDAPKLENYVRVHSPAYKMLDDLSDEQIGIVKQLVLDELRIDALPAAIVTSGDGRVLETMWEVPSISDIRAFLARGDI